MKTSFQVILNSLHKYKPKISIIDVMLKKKIYETSFEETEFIAVTAYQNDDVRKSSWNVSLNWLDLF